MAWIKAEGISLEYPVYDVKERSLKGRFQHQLAGGVISESKSNVVITALNGVSFDAAAGDRYAVIGQNGAGKTSLLRVLGGIYEPTRGRVSFEGYISTMFSRALGMNMDASGYDNIYICGLLWGMSPKEIREKSDSIAEFTELGDYLELPVRTYSNGMLARLSFAIATARQPEILLIDETFGAGDRAFQEKARNRIIEMAHKAAILFFALHSPGTLREFCDKALWLHGGNLMAIGDFEDVAERYLSFRNNGGAPETDDGTDDAQSA